MYSQMTRLVQNRRKWRTVTKPSGDRWQKKNELEGKFYFTRG